MGNEQTRIERVPETRAPRPSQGQVLSNRGKWALRAIKTARISQDFSPGTPGTGKTSLQFHLGALWEEAGACGVVGRRLERVVWCGVGQLVQ